MNRNQKQTAAAAKYILCWWQQLVNLGNFILLTTFNMFFFFALDFFPLVVSELIKHASGNCQLLVWTAVKLQNRNRPFFLYAWFRHTWSFPKHHTGGRISKPYWNVANMYMDVWPLLSIETVSFHYLNIQKQVIFYPLRSKKKIIIYCGMDCKWDYFSMQKSPGNMHLHTSIFLFLVSPNFVFMSGYFPERHPKQSNVKGPPPFLPFNTKSQGKRFKMLLYR